MPEELERKNRIAYAAHQLMTRRVSELMQERAQLEGEIRQLRAAVHIWTAVAEQTSLSSGRNPECAGTR
jgi:hypothetical protein